ncbi:hypothetical protein SODALDRAFT_262927, partial [Sodiomyces alkalinus F11]
VKTRILILSDTHGLKPQDSPGGPKGAKGTPPSGYRYPLPEADVAIHCGDLTSNSNIPELEDTFSMLRQLSAPLKLVIAGNHDLALDRNHWDSVVESLEARGRIPLPVVEQYKRCPVEFQRIIDAARQDGVIYLPDDGVYDFELGNGARLRVFASPMTPSYGAWAFQYPRGTYKFDIPAAAGIDVVVSHGPPRGVLDRASNGQYAGCDELFAAVCASRPQIHCFGHIHEAWGAELVTWKKPPPSDDKYNSAAAPLARSNAYGSGPEGKKAAKAKVARFYRDKCVPVDITSAGRLSLRPGEQTLFVNAAIMNRYYRPANVPWLVDIDLPKAG